VVAVAAIVAAGLLLLIDGTRAGRRSAPARALRTTSAPVGSTAAAPLPARADDCPSAGAAQSLLRPQDRDFLPWVQWKYRYLLADVQLAPCARELLEELLAARERLAHDAASSESPTGLDDIDQHVRGLLPAGAQADAFDELRDSDTEQRQLDDYANGLANVAPLREEQKRAVLSARLRRKREFESAVREAGLDRAALSADERMQAQVIVQQALDRYRDDFLLDASEILDEEQLGYLSNYETTEFEREAERLHQIAINGR
jgi:hypothetical protein